MQPTLVKRNTGGTKLHDLLDEMEVNGVLDDRREYDASDLKLMYSLTDEEADDLFYLVQRQFDPDPAPSIDNIPADLIKEAIQEGFHSGWDCWTEHEWLIISRYTDDLCRYGKYLARNIKES